MTFPILLQKLFDEGGGGNKLKQDIIPPVKSKTTNELSTFTGAAGEITFDTTAKRLVAHDGTTKGGISMARVSELESAKTELQGKIDQVTNSLDPRILDAASQADILEAVGQVTGGGSVSQPTLEGLQSQISANASNIDSKLPSSTAHVVEYWKRSDGQNWYRKWSNGWIEQGGWRTVSANSTSSGTFTFHVPFTTTDYTLILSKSDATYGKNGQAWTGLNSWTETGFNVYLNYVKKFHYYACGF